MNTPSIPQVCRKCKIRNPFELTRREARRQIAALLADEARRKEAAQWWRWN